MCLSAENARPREGRPPESHGGKDRMQKMRKQGPQAGQEEVNLSQYFF
jgi:hypothetical protein